MSSKIKRQFALIKEYQRKVDLARNAYDTEVDYLEDHIAKLLKMVKKELR